MPPSTNGTPSWIRPSLQGTTGCSWLHVGRDSGQSRDWSHQQATTQAPGQWVPPKLHPHPTRPEPTPHLQVPLPRDPKSACCLRLMVVTAHLALSAYSPTLHFLPPPPRPPQKTPPHQCQAISQHIAKPGCMGRITTPALPRSRIHITWYKRGCSISKSSHK